MVENRHSGSHDRRQKEHARKSKLASRTDTLERSSVLRLHPGASMVWTHAKMTPSIYDLQQVGSQHAVVAGFVARTNALANLP